MVYDVYGMVLATLIHLPPSKILSHMVELWSRDVAVYGVQHAHSASGMNNKSLRSASNIKDTDCSRIVRHTISWLLCWCMQNDILSINCFFIYSDWLNSGIINFIKRQTNTAFVYCRSVSIPIKPGPTSRWHGQSLSSGFMTSRTPIGIYYILLYLSI